MMKDKEIKDAVREGYAKIARQSEKTCCSDKSPCCCGGAGKADDISIRAGYREEDLSSAPEGANLGLGCGNPVALASIGEGEHVLDLGSGAGFDCFLASRRAGDGGKVIGVDMTPEMIERARNNAISGGFSNVEFRLGEIESLPVDDSSIDVIISNCVINLSPDKHKVFKEAFRVLRPGGRLMVSDIVLLKDLPEFIRNSLEGYIGCVSGAMLKDEYVGAIKKAGFQDVTILEEKGTSFECIAGDPIAKAIIDNCALPQESMDDVASSVVSVCVRAIKG